MAQAPSRIRTKSGRYYITPASIWSQIKTVTQGKNGKKHEEDWSENTKIDTLREYGAVFVNDAFFPLIEIEDGIISMDGGYGSSKTTFAITKLLLKCIENDYFRCYYGRQRKTDARNLHSNIITEIKRNKWERFFKYSEEANGHTNIYCTVNGNKFILFGCDDDESLKGWDNPTDVLIDEVNQLEFSTFGMIITRLRGMGYKTQLIMCFNNCDVYSDHWLRKLIYRQEGDEELTDEEEIMKEALEGVNLVTHHSTYRDNLFQNPDKYYYKLVLKAAGKQHLIDAYCEGAWGVSLEAQPYYKNFSPKDHIRPCIIRGQKTEGYNPLLPLHISWDDNVNPYLPCLIAQVDGKTVYFIDEITFKNPKNKVEYVCDEILKRFPGHSTGLYIYGDATAVKEDTKQTDGEDFFMLIMRKLVRMSPTNRVPRSNPSNKMRGNFMNAIFGLDFGQIKILVSPKCKKFIEDLTNCQEDPAPNRVGHKDKRTTMVDGVRGVQKYGHLGDCMDYFMCMYFSHDYGLYQSGGYSHDAVGGDRIVKNGFSPQRAQIYVAPVIEDEKEEVTSDISWGGRRKSRNSY